MCDSSSASSIKYIKSSNILKKSLFKIFLPDALFELLLYLDSIFVYKKWISIDYTSRKYRSCLQFIHIILISFYITIKLKVTHLYNYNNGQDMHEWMIPLTRDGKSSGLNVTPISVLPPLRLACIVKHGCYLCV